jgi:hypothetical protein
MGRVGNRNRLVRLPAPCDQGCPAGRRFGGGCRVIATTVKGGLNGWWNLFYRLSLRRHRRHYFRPVVIGVTIFVLSLIWRFVVAHERMANSLEMIARKMRDAAEPDGERF